MELIEKERKQREQVGAFFLSLSVKFLIVSIRFISFLFCFFQMFLLKADQMKRYEKEKVGCSLGWSYVSYFVYRVSAKSILKVSVYCKPPS